MSATKFSVYADGSSGGNSTGAIGWGWVVLMNGAVLCAGTGGAKIGTNNIAELMGACEGLRGLVAHPEFKKKMNEIYSIELVSDSQYVLGLASGAFIPSANRDLARDVRTICMEFVVATRWVRGHSGDPLNEMCDKLAKYGKLLHGGVPKNTSRGAKRRERRKELDKMLLKE